MIKRHKKIENVINFKIKTRYYLERLIPETMTKVTKDKMLKLCHS